MGTSAFDQLWTTPAQQPGDALDALWDHPATDAAARLHAEYASGRLAKRMQRENQNEREAADAESVSGPRAFAQSLAATGANIAQGIPGMEAAQAGVRSLARGQSYRDALSDIRGATGKIPTVLKYGERIAGAVPLAAVLPSSAAASGAIVGGADQALSADPDQSLGGRALRTGLGAAGGALIGKATDAAVTGVKSLLTKNPASLLLQKQAERAASARDLYGAALAEGRGNEATPAIRSFLADPDVQGIVEGLRQTDQFRNAAPESPEMLDAIYKTFSDQAKRAQKGLDALNPTQANQGRFRLANIKSKQQQLLRAMGATGEKPALALDVAPEVFETQPAIAAGRDALSGPISPSPLATNTSAPNPTLSQGLRNFAGDTPNAMQGPGGPAFQLRAQPDRVTPGVRIETPAMRVQTAPAQQLPAMMPGYQKAVEDFAKKSQEIAAIERGYDALRGSLSDNLPTAKNLTRKTPQAFAEWAAKASPEEVQAARQGILGASKMSMHGSLNPLKGFGVLPSLSSASKASSLLQAANTPSQTYLQLLQNLGLLGAGTATSP